MTYKTVLPNGFLLQLDDGYMRLYKPTKNNQNFWGKYRYYISREIIDYEVQWLPIDTTVVEKEIQQYISSLVRNTAFI